MTDIEIEKLLRAAPQVSVPAGLLQNLIADISLPQPKTRGLNHFDPKSFFRRWFPAISFAAFLLMCAVVVAVQTNWLSQLRSENKTLRAASQNLEGLRNGNLEYQKLLAANGELERLRKDALEIPKLRAEVEQLRSQMLELQNLRAENQQLLAAIKVAQQESEEEDPFAKAKAKAEMIACINNLKQIQLAAMLWAQDHGAETLPADFLSLKDYSPSPAVFKCPSDDKKVAAKNWGIFGPANNSYEVMSPNVSLTNRPAETVFSHCPIHHTAGFVDGHVEQLGKRTLFRNGDVTRVQREIHK